MNRIARLARILFVAGILLYCFSLYQDAQMWQDAYRESIGNHFDQPESRPNPVILYAI